MKLHSNNWSKHPIVWHDGDVLMISVVFTWQLPIVRRLCEWNHQAGKHIRVGGTAVEFSLLRNGLLTCGIMKLNVTKQNCEKTIDI